MKSKWKPTKVNGRWCMTRCTFINTVESRKLNWWERIRFFWLKDDNAPRYTLGASDRYTQSASEFTCLCQKQKGWVTAGRWTEECPRCGRIYFGQYNPKTLHIEAIEQNQKV